MNVRKKRFMMSEHKSILVESEKLVHGDRNDSYGHPLDDFKRTAKMWSAILGIEIDPEQVGLCMIAVKLSRECHKPKRDNLVDIAGYAETVEWCKDEKYTREVNQETFFVSKEACEKFGKEALKPGKNRVVVEGENNPEITIHRESASRADNDVLPKSGDPSLQDMVDSAEALQELANETKPREKQCPGCLRYFKDRDSNALGLCGKCTALSRLDKARK